jgi:hypothetical protein
VQIVVRVELEPAPAGECGCRAVSVTIDGVEKKVETYNSVPMAAELPGEKSSAVSEEKKEEEDYAQEKDAQS